MFGDSDNACRSESEIILNNPTLTYQFDQGGVGEGRSDLVISVYFSVLRKLEADIRRL